MSSLCALAGLVLAAAGVQAQNIAPAVVQTNSSAGNALYGSVDTLPVTATPVQLSLDDAIHRALDHSLALALSTQNERVFAGQKLTAFNALVPGIQAKAFTGTQAIDLAALGFKPSILQEFSSALHFPAGTAFPSIVKVNTTGAQASLTQYLFNLPAIEYYRAARAYQGVSGLNTLNARGNVILIASSAYLQTLAAASQLQNEQAQLRADQTALDQAVQAHAAGVATNLDELRARVQFQRQQQAVVTAENTLAKRTIALNRIIGLAPEQAVELTDAAPYSELTMLSLDEAKRTAYQRRKDYLALKAQMRTAGLVRKAAVAERMPTVALDGYYGVIGETHGLYHGVYTAEGSIRLPLFREAQLRGDRDVADAQLSRLRAQVADLEVTIEAQLRSSMMDVEAASELVRVARSSVDLAQQELSDTNDRFRAGVSDNLPVVQAQATVASAQTQLVNALYEYNQAKLNLARVTGVIESQYQAYLGF